MIEYHTNGNGKMTGDFSVAGGFADERFRVCVPTAFCAAEFAGFSGAFRRGGETGARVRNGFILILLLFAADGLLRTAVSEYLSALLAAAGVILCQLCVCAERFLPGGARAPVPAALSLIGFFLPGLSAGLPGTVRGVCARACSGGGLSAAGTKVPSFHMIS